MKKTILICLTAIICVAILATPIYAMLYMQYSESQNKEVGWPVTPEYNVNLETTSTNELPYGNIQVLAKLGDYAVLVIDQKTGALYRVYAHMTGDIAVTRSVLR